MDKSHRMMIEWVLKKLTLYIQTTKLRRYLDPQNISKTPSQEVFGCLGLYHHLPFQLNVLLGMLPLPTLPGWHEPFLGVGDPCKSSHCYWEENIAIEYSPFVDAFPIGNMVIFNGYVCLEGHPPKPLIFQCIHIYIYSHPLFYYAYIYI